MSPHIRSRACRRRPGSLFLEHLESRVVPSFVAPLAFDSGTDAAASVAVGDFNADRLPDFVTGSVLLLRNGDGTFQAARPHGVRGPSGAVADVNNDGRLDVAVAVTSSHAAYVLLGNGDGTFQNPRNFPVGLFPMYIVAGDVNNDGRPDLVTGGIGSFPSFTNNVSVLLGNGDGTFQNAQSYVSGAGGVAVRIALGDVNADSRLDLAVTHANASLVNIFLGNGDGSFQGPQPIAVGARPYAVAVGDVDADGRLDLTTANPLPDTVAVLLGNGDGSFQGPQFFPVGSDPSFVVVSDVNADGRLDVVAVNGGNSSPWYNNGSVSVLLGNGDGMFQGAHNYLAGDGPLSVAVSDINADGRSDLVVGNGLGLSVSVLLGNGDGSFENVPHFVAGSRPSSVAVADVNGDSRLDLVVANEGTCCLYSDSSVSVLLGNGDGTFQAARFFSAGGRPMSVAVGDVNGDGRLDLAVANALTDNVSVLLGNGDGSFQNARNFATGRFPSSVAVGDVNGDTRLDLAVANNGTRNVSVLLGNGNGSFQNARNFPTVTPPWSLVMADLNTDGRLDVVVTDSEASVGVLLGNGNGTFRAIEHFVAGSLPYSVAVADVNTDGRLDIITTNRISNNVGVLLGNGDGSFEAVRWFAAGSRPSAVAVWDVNGDGRLDLTVVAGTARVLLGNGDGTFQTTTVSYVAGAGAIALAAADFNGDGFRDLAVANSGSNNVSFLQNDGYWGGPAVYFYIYPDSGTVTAGQPFDVYVIPLNASFEVVTNYTGQILFWATDPQATTPVYYRFQLADRGIASFPGGLTFNTPGLQELYVFDWPGIQVWGYAAFDVRGAAPGGGGDDASPRPALDLFASEVLSHPAELPVRLPDTPAVLPLEESRPTVSRGPLAAPLAAPEALPPPLLDRLFAGRYDQETWDPLSDGPLGAGV